MRKRRTWRILLRLVSLVAILALAIGVSVPGASAATPDEINQAIEDGMAWLAGHQNPNGSWGGYAYVAHAGLAVLKFETHAVFMGMSPYDPGYAYHQEVEDGLNYIFSQLEAIPISPQPAGNPDSNGNGIGVRAAAWDGYHYTYESAIALMAICASNEPAMVVGVGSQAGRTFADVAQDIVDYFAFGQNDGGAERGGWGYHENDAGWSDNSNAGYATLGLGFAEAPPPFGFGLPIPGFVFTELSSWVAYIQNTTGVGWYYAPLGGSGYSNPQEWENVLKTGNLLQQQSMVGLTQINPPVQAALGYIETHWNDANQDPGWNGGPGNVNYQACFTMMKGFQSYGITLLDIDGNNVPETDWYDEMSDVIVATQNPDGSWPSDYWGDPPLTTAWAMLTLEKAAPPALSLLPPFDVNPPGSDHTVTAVYKIGGVPQAGVQINFEVIAGPNAGESGSAVTDANGEASFTYTGTGGPGTDTIRATAVDDTGAPLISSQAQKEWKDGVPPQEVPGVTGWGMIAAALIIAALIPLGLRRRQQTNKAR